VRKEAEYMVLEFKCEANLEAPNLDIVPLIIMYGQ